MPDQHPIVKAALRWCDALNTSADAAFNRATLDHDVGAIDYAAFTRALRDKGKVLAACLDITTNASSALLAVAEADLGGIREATNSLSTAIDRIKLVQDAVSLLGELAVAAVALSVAVAAPTPASLAAAAAALGKAGKRVASKIGD